MTWMTAKGLRATVRSVTNLPGTRQWAIETNIGTMVMVHPGPFYPLYGPTPPRKKEVDGGEWIEGYREWGRARS